MKQKLICIIGQTATGKSDIAVAIAQKFNGEVVSADSRQVYRGMNLGTGKITKQEMKGIPHHMIDVITPKRAFSAGRFQKEGKKIIESIWKRNKLPIVCGGTGFYVSVLLDGLILPDVKKDIKLRNTLKQKNTEELFHILSKLDPKRAKKIDHKNPHRLIRAIEIAKTLGNVPELKKNPVRADTLFIGIKRNDLKKRIHVRLLKRVRKGMIYEIQNLHDSGITWKRLESFGLEYAYGSLFLQKQLDKKSFLDELERAIIQYAKRQMTWFKKNTRIIWVSKKQEALKLARLFMKQVR